MTEDIKGARIPFVLYVELLAIARIFKVSVDKKSSRLFKSKGKAIQNFMVRNLENGSIQSSPFEHVFPHSRSRSALVVVTLISIFSFAASSNLPLSNQIQCDSPCESTCSPASRSVKNGCWVQCPAYFVV